MESGTIYEAVGGEVGIARIVHAFYENMNSRPEAHALRSMYPNQLEGPSKRLTLFLSAWWGGPPTYHLTYGHPRLRASHAGFAIDTEVRDLWLSCMEDALRSTVTDPIRERVWPAIQQTAEHIRNQD